MRDPGKKFCTSCGAGPKRAASCCRTSSVAIIVVAAFALVVALGVMNLDGTVAARLAGCRCQLEGRQGRLSRHVEESRS